MKLKVDDVEADIKAIVVNDNEQNIPVIVRRSFTELPQVTVYKDNNKLKFVNRSADPILDINIDPTKKKIVLRADEKSIIPGGHMSFIKASNDEYVGDVYIENSIRPQEGREHCIPQTVIEVNEVHQARIPVINLSSQGIIIKKGVIIARGWPCEGESAQGEEILSLTSKQYTEINFDELTIGDINEAEKGELIEILKEFRDCIAQNTNELGCAKSTQMRIELENNQTFCCRPYRMAKAEQETVNDIVNELQENEIVRESNSNYSSPVVLVRKKNGEQRLCIDYRKLNAHTIRDNYPLPRIDDQIDRLQSGVYLTSLDLKSGYHQIPIEESSKRYTSFVTPTGQYEYNRMPFGLTNAPRTFQRFMNKILGPVADIAAVYLDDVLLHAKTVPEALNGIRKILQIFRDEGITLNLKKCSFLMKSATFLGFEIGGGRIKPGREKTMAVERFQTPKSVHQIRQFLGLTGYFRQFVKAYATIARPLTALVRKSVNWKWTEEEENAFQRLKQILVERPVLALFNPSAVTEVHTDASAIGLAGILLQVQDDNRLHPVSYFSRQTKDPETKFHSYELETLAVVESLKKFRPYLLGMKFTVVTDCNALKATKSKKQLIPRIARWWLSIQEFTFDVKYRPGERMKHVDALSRNPTLDNETEIVMHITEADWVLAGQLTDDKIQRIHKVLSLPPKMEYDKNIYKNYTLRDGRIYRITARGLQWVAPRGMRQQVIKAAHDELGHFALEKTLRKLCEHYWFPRMREYVQKYIACCIRCLYNKRAMGRKEGYLHPIPKHSEPMRTVHIDHLGPFPKSRRGNLFTIVIVDAFTKFVFLKAVKSTKTKLVIDFFKHIFSMYGIPKIIISDQGSSFTSKDFSRFCQQNNIQHTKNAVATPRANGQVERINRSILTALTTTTLEEDKWDDNLKSVQFAINNVINKSTGKTPSELLFGYKPRGGSDIWLSDEINQTSDMINDLITKREEAAKQIIKAQEEQKRSFDRRRKKPRKYKIGDIVLIEKNEPAMNTSRKLIPPYSGPLVVKAVLPNDRYIVKDMVGSQRTGKKASYEKVIAVDRMKQWCPTGGVSDATNSESGEDGVVLSSEEESVMEQLETSS